MGLEACTKGLQEHTPTTANTHVSPDTSTDSCFGHTATQGNKDTERMHLCKGSCQVRSDVNHDQVVLGIGIVVVVLIWLVSLASRAFLENEREEEVITRFAIALPV